MTRLAVLLLIGLTLAAGLWLWEPWVEPVPDPLAVGSRATLPERLGAVRSWACQLTGLDRDGAIDRLVSAPVDLLTIEPTTTVRGMESFPIGDAVARIKAPRNGRHRLVLAYLNIGQAENYRTYWQSDWQCPVDPEAPRDGFLICKDPDGWAGNFPIAFWDPSWRHVVFGSPEAMLDRIVAHGFDGVYLDWVLGFADPSVMAAAKREGVDAPRAMAELVRDIRAHARQTRPGFLVVAQNPEGLIDLVPEIADWIDGVAQEGLSHSGGAGTDWSSPDTGGQRRAPTGVASTAEYAARLRKYRERELPVFTMDYAIDPADIEAAAAISRRNGFVPFVSRTPLDRLPQHLFDAAGSR